ncbi:MAG TPA: baseplate J/gp47 family protein [Pyrinomonadaceae bacterium]|jgi:uncharacterized phage protein gp47/JayE
MQIPRPILEIRDEDRFAAEAIGKISGGIDVARIASQIRKLQELLKLIAGGNLPATPACPELTNANPSSAHTVLLEAIAWMLSQLAYLINQIPDQNVIAFHNLFGSEMREAKAATTVLRFTTNFPYNGSNETLITVPAGTEVSAASGKFVFKTLAEAQIQASVGFKDVPAERTITGATLLSPFVLTVINDALAWVNSVTNPFAIDSGSRAETVEEATERAVQFQRRGLRIVTNQDLEEAIVTEVFEGGGIARVFPFVKYGQFTESPQLGYSTVVIATSNGFPVSDALKLSVRELFEQLPGNQYFSIADPTFKTFDVAAQIQLSPGAQNTVVFAEIDQNLRAFYSVARQNFGRPIKRSEIIQIIENTRGVDFIKTSGEILISPASDIELAPWELPFIGEIAIS